MASHSHVLVYHGPLQIATFWEWLAIYFHYGVYEWKFETQTDQESYFFLLNHSSCAWPLTYMVSWLVSLQDIKKESGQKQTKIVLNIWICVYIIRICPTQIYVYICVYIYVQIKNFFHDVTLVSAPDFG